MAPNTDTKGFQRFLDSLDPTENTTSKRVVRGQGDAPEGIKVIKRKR